MTDSLDLRDMPHEERHETVMEKFKDVEEGEKLVLINDHDPTPLIHELREAVDGFDENQSDLRKEERNKFVLELCKSEMVDGDGVLEVLKEVVDPDLGVNIVDAGVVNDVRTESGETGSSEALVAIEPMGLSEDQIDGLEDKIEEAVRENTGFSEVDVIRGGFQERVSEQDVWDRLSDVQHPDHPDDVVETGTINDIEVDGDTVTVSVNTEEWSNYLRENMDEFFDLLGTSVYNCNGVNDVRVNTGESVKEIESKENTDPPIADSPGMAGPPGAEGMTPLDQPGERDAAPPNMDLSDIDGIVLVASAKGGVGKTTVATQLARGLAKEDLDVGLLDADFSGPDVPEVLGLDAAMSGMDVVEPVVHDGIQVMSVGLMENRPTAWNGRMVHNSLFNLIEDVSWDVDTLVVDVPPGASDTLMTLLQFVPIDGVVLVTTPHPTSVSETARGAALFREGGVPILGAVVNMASYRCPSCGDEHSLYDAVDLGEKFDYPVLAELPFSEDVRSIEGDIPEVFNEVVGTVEQRVVDEAGTELEVGDEALDVRDYPQHSRIDEVREEFLALEPGEQLMVVSDQNPAGIAVSLVDVLDTEGAPSEVFDEYVVKPFDEGKWLLKLRKP